MTIRAHLLERLEADATLTGILSGGIYDASELPEDGLTPSAVPDAYNGVRLLPCAVIRWRTESESEIVGSSRRRFYEIYFYQAVGQVSIEAAMKRCRVLLHPHVQGKTDSDQVYYTTWIDHAGDMIADELDGAAMSYSRYYVDFVEVL